ncbi:hypothetical protein [Virgibacillus ainsalahensis]
MNEHQLYQEIFKVREQLSNLYSEYWSLYSGMDTWYFWVNIASVLLPLIFLYFVIDRKRLFEISFFGFTIHILWMNVDTILAEQNFLIHPHTLTPLTTSGITVTAVLLPVTFMLLYQHCTNKGKNFYFYAVIASVIFAFGLGGLSSIFGLLEFHKGMNLTYLLFIDVGIAFLSLWFTKLFLKIKNTDRKI